MDINDLKNTSDAQFKKDISFNAEMPDGTETELVLTIKSARNPEVKGKLGKLISQTKREWDKLDRPNVSEEVHTQVAEKVSVIDKQIARLMLVKFEGLTDGDKPYPCNKITMEGLIDDHVWVRENIVSKAMDQTAFYNV